MIREKKVEGLSILEWRFVEDRETLINSPAGKSVERLLRIWIDKVFYKRRMIHQNNLFGTANREIPRKEITKHLQH